MDFIAYLHISPLWRWCLCDYTWLKLQVFANELPNATAVRVQYNDKGHFKMLAKQLGIMEDFKVRMPNAISTISRCLLSFSRTAASVVPFWTGANVKKINDVTMYSTKP